MAASNHETLIYGVRLSSIGPGQVTGQNVVHDPTNMDLAMKLHYLKTVYYFRSEAVQGLTITKIKEPTFTWLNYFPTTCGRFRRSEPAGRPYIKCNDCGIRCIEAHCVKTLDEWLEMEDDSLHKLLLPNQVIGPELQFSPTVLLQFTWFKCGGMSLGLSWAHVLGDALSASDFMNALGQVMAGHHLAQQSKPARQQLKSPVSPSPPNQSKDPLSVNRIGPVGDHWIITNSCKMETFSFHLTTKMVNELHSRVCGQIGKTKIPLFESLCALIWKSVAKIRDGLPKVVTICKNDPHNHKIGILSNGQAISVVKANLSILEANPKELADLMANQAMDERGKIEEAVEMDPGFSDPIVYGANLTFVDLEALDLYGLELKGKKPVHVSHTIDGIGEEGVVLVLPGPIDDGEDGNRGRTVTLIMPENQVSKLKSELKQEFSIA